MNFTSSFFSFYGHLIDYGIDFGQRALLFTDILRRRGNNYLEHLRLGQPPVLVFDYDVITDGRSFASTRQLCARPNPGSPPSRRSKPPGGESWTL